MSKQLEAYYGLPHEVKFCKRCVISNQRPNSCVEFKHQKDSRKETINFDAEGVCDACLLAEQKQTQIDWSSRDKELRELCDRYRRDDGEYDCLVPGSGGKDSFYASWMLKYEYGMHPLTVTWSPHLYTDWGWANHRAWINSGFDNYLMTPNSRVHRLLTRLAVDNLFHPFQPFILGQKNLAPKMAAIFKIPLVFYGENEAEYGNPVADATKPVRDWTYFTQEDGDQIFLAGTSVTELKSRYGLTANDLDIYLPVDPRKLSEIQAEVHYLGYYLPWHPQSCYYLAVEKGGFRASPERTPGTYSKYNSLDDKIDDLHYYTTYVKFGIGRASYDAAQEIRSGDITRDEAVQLVERFDGEWPSRFESELMDYLTVKQDEMPKAYDAFEHPIMSKERFLELADSFRSPHLWKFENEKWQLRHTVY